MAEDLPIKIFLTIFLLMFLTFSGYCTIVWMTMSKNLKQVLNDKEKHWSLRWIVYYGIGFSIFLVVTVCLSFIFGITMYLWGL